MMPMKPCTFNYPNILRHSTGAAGGSGGSGGSGEEEGRRAGSRPWNGKRRAGRVNGDRNSAKSCGNNQLVKRVVGRVDNVDDHVFFVVWPIVFVIGAVHRVR